ncbi:unnamed protein product [Durusdinium trenchii]
MTELLTVTSNSKGRMNVPRTQTAHDDPEMALLLGSQIVQGSLRWCACCYQRKSETATSQARRTTSFDQTFSLPSHDDMADELREPTPDEMRRSPEAVVLRPVKLVLKWFEKIEPLHSRRDPRAEVLRGIPPGGSPNAAMAQIKGVPCRK